MSVVCSFTWVREVAVWCSPRSSVTIPLKLCGHVSGWGALKVRLMRIYASLAMQVSRAGDEAECGKSLSGFARQARQEQAEGDQSQPFRGPAQQERGGDRCKYSSTMLPSHGCMIWGL